MRGLKVFDIEFSRSMAHLACRFCRDDTAVHVVDPLLDLRYRFRDLEALACMLRARRLEIDAQYVAVKYHKWWDSYSLWRDSSIRTTTGELSRDRELRQRMLEESDGLLDALKLPNDVSRATPIAFTDSQDGEIDDEQSYKHMSLLRLAGMIKVEPSTSNVHLVGLPAALQHSLQNLFTEVFAENTLTVSPSYFVRGAIIDGVNMPKESFPLIASNTSRKTDLFLTGCSLPSLVALFVKKSFSSQTNKWPIRLLSSGTFYCGPSYLPFSSTNLNNLSQHAKTVLLSLCRTEEEENAEYARFVELLQVVLEKKLSLKVISSPLYAHNLFNYESAATGIVTAAGVEIARICTIGSYISHRLNILREMKSEAFEFIRMTSAEVSLARVVAAVLEEHLMKGPVPESIRRLLQCFRTD